MKKQVATFTEILILLTKFMSAYSYNSASIGDFFDSLGGENLWLVIVFFVSLALITTILNRTKFFEENKAASGIISLMLSIGITYGLYSQGIMFDVTNIFSSFGISEKTIDLLVFFGGAIFLLILLIKLKTDVILLVGAAILGINLVLGGVSLEVSFFGGILIVVWIFLKYIVFRVKNPWYGAYNSSKNIKLNLGRR
jgi:hypothetical protein